MIYATKPKLSTGGELHQLKLGEGATLEGRVMKDGQPLAGVEVGISGSERRSEVFVGNMTVGTDAEGRFHFSNVTPDTSYQIYGIMKSLGAKGALLDRQVSVQNHGSTLDIGDLKLETGYKVAGVVRLAGQKPVPEATRVILGRHTAWDSQQAEVDSDGRFEFQGVPAESITLSTRVTGYRLTTRNGSMDPLNTSSLIGTVQGNKTNLIIELEPGARLEPLRDGSQIALRNEPIRGAEGGDKVSDGIEVTGTVTDEATGKPIQGFAVAEGRFESRPGEIVTWFSTRKTEYRDGHFSINLAAPRQGRIQPAALQVGAEGYVPQQSGRITGTTNLTFALRRGAGPEGILLKPDGSPAANIPVYLTDMRDGVYVQGPKLEVRSDIYRGTRKTTTDERGRFSFAPQVDAYSIIVIDEAGFVEVKVAELAEQRETRLKAWARVEGNLRIGSKPGSHEQVRLWPAHLPYADHPRSLPALSLYLNTETDDDGNFVFERVPPIPVEVYHSPKVRPSTIGTTAMSQSQKVSLQPARIAKINLGGKGRPVTGRIVLAGYEGQFDWLNDSYMMISKPPKPADLPDLLAQSRRFSDESKAAVTQTEEEKNALMATHQHEREKTIEAVKAYYRTERGWSYYAAQNRYALKFSKDGSFRIDDVPGGSYDLRLMLRDGDTFPGKILTHTEKELEIPEAVGGRSDEPYDVGAIEVAVKMPLKPGKIAPDFEINTVDGKAVKLGDFKGKFLLLDFWAVWCGPCVAETPYLKKTYEAFKSDPRFAMLGLSLDPEKEAPIQYQKKNQLGWIQGFLGDWSKATLPGQYGVQGIPAIFLIDPDGNILRSDLRGEQIKSAVQAALRNAK